MSNVIQFPVRRPPQPTADALTRELTAVELELARARLAQVQAETRQINALWISYCLKRVLFWGALLWLLSHFVGVAKAEPWTSRSYYNERGSFAGSSVERGKSTSFYDARGRFSGSAIKHGNSTSFYDGRGRFIGSTIDTPPRR